MRPIGFLTILSIFIISSTNIAQASNFWDWFITPDMPNFEQPYLEDGKNPNHAYWKDDTWTPETWIKNRGNAQIVIKELYEGKIIIKQYTEGDMPILKVGQGFMNLSSLDQHRVATFVDYVYKVTSLSPNGMFMLYHWETNKPIGIYTKNGLQIQ